MSNNENSESYIQKWLFEQQRLEKSKFNFLQTIDSYQYHILEKNGGKLEIALRVAY